MITTESVMIAFERMEDFEYKLLTKHQLSKLEIEIDAICTFFFEQLAA